MNCRPVSSMPVKILGSHIHKRHIYVVMRAFFDALKRMKIKTTYMFLLPLPLCIALRRARSSV